jgi:hypothetical protein
MEMLANGQLETVMARQGGMAGSVGKDLVSPENARQLALMVAPALAVSKHRFLP